MERSEFDALDRRAASRDGDRLTRAAMAECLRQGRWDLSKPRVELAEAVIAGGFTQDDLRFLDDAIRLAGI